MQTLSNNLNFNSPGPLLGHQERFKVYYRNIKGRCLKNEKKMVQLIFQVSDLVHGPRTKSNEKHKIDAGKIAY